MFWSLFKPLLRKPIARRPELLAQSVPTDQREAVAEALASLMRGLDTPAMQGVADDLVPDLGDDDYDMFRAWVILQGRRRYERAVANPEVIATWPPSPEELLHAEPLLYAFDVDEA